MSAAFDSPKNRSLTPWCLGHLPQPLLRPAAQAMACRRSHEAKKKPLWHRLAGGTRYWKPWWLDEIPKKETPPRLSIHFYSVFDAIYLYYIYIRINWLKMIHWAEYSKLGYFSLPQHSGNSSCPNLWETSPTNTTSNSLGPPFDGPWYRPDYSDSGPNMPKRWFTSKQSE